MGRRLTVPAPEHNVVWIWAAGERYDACILGKSGRYEEPQRKGGQAMESEVLRPGPGPEFDASLNRVCHVMLFELESLADALRVGAEVFKDLWVGANRVAEYGGLAQFAQRD